MLGICFKIVKVSFICTNVNTRTAHAHVRDLAQSYLYDVQYSMVLRNTVCRCSYSVLSQRHSRLRLIKLETLDTLSSSHGTRMMYELEILLIVLKQNFGKRKVLKSI